MPLVNSSAPFIPQAAEGTTAAEHEIKLSPFRYAQSHQVCYLFAAK